MSFLPEPVLHLAFAALKMKVYNNNHVLSRNVHNRRTMIGLYHFKRQIMVSTSIEVCAMKNDML